jgi:hypothetical protein
MQKVADVLLYEHKFYNTEIEIDFFIEKEELTWHIAVQFLKKNGDLVKSVYFNKKNIHFKQVITDVYWEVNNDPLLRYGLDDLRLSKELLAADFYANTIYPLLARLRISRKDTMTDRENRIVFQNSVHKI